MIRITQNLIFESRKSSRSERVGENAMTSHASPEEKVRRENSIKEIIA